MSDVPVSWALAKLSELASAAHVERDKHLSASLAYAHEERKASALWLAHRLLKEAVARLSSTGEGTCAPTPHHSQRHRHDGDREASQTSAQPKARVLSPSSLACLKRVAGR